MLDLHPSRAVFALILGSGPSHARSVISVTCKDGSRISGDIARRGACPRHGGIDTVDAAEAPRSWLQVTFRKPGPSYPLAIFASCLAARAAASLASSDFRPATSSA